MRTDVVGRLGVRELAGDHVRTLYELDSEGTRHRSIADILIFFAVPVATFAGLWLGDFRLRDTGQVLAGVAIFTGLLFGLLVHVFAVGLQISDSPRFTTTSRVTLLVDELRANVAYACGVGLLLTMILLVSSAFATTTPPGVSGTAPEREVIAWASSAIAALVLHLVLTMLMVLKRLRTAYTLLAK